MVYVLHEAVKVQAALFLGRRAVEKAVHQEALSAPHSAPQVDAAHHAPPRQQPDQRGVEALQPEQVLVQALHTLERALLGIVEAVAVYLGVLPDPLRGAGAVVRQDVMAETVVGRWAHGEVFSCSGVPTETASDVDGALVHPERRLVHDFRQRRMSVNDAGDVLGAGVELHRNHRFGDELGGKRPDDVHSQDTVGALVGQHLDETDRFAEGARAAVGHERKLSAAVGGSGRTQFLFGFAHPGDFRRGVDDPRHRFEIDVACLAGYQLGDRDALLRGLVRKHRPAHHIPARVYIGQITAAMLVGLHEAALVDRQPDRIRSQAGGIGRTADRDDELVEFRALRAAVDLELHFHLFFRRCHRVYLHAGANRQPGLLAEDFQSFLGHLFVRCHQEARQRFEYGHVSAQAPPYAAHFQPYYASSHHAQALGHLGQRQRAGVVEDLLVVERRQRKLARHRPGGDDDVPGLDGLRLVAIFHFEHIGRTFRHEASGAMEGHHLVLPEQPGDAAGEAVDDLVLACEHDADVEADFLGGDAVRGELVRDALVVLGGFQQCLRGNAPDVEAGAAEAGLAGGGLPLVSAEGVETQLRAADGGYVAARAAADDGDIVCVWHGNPSGGRKAQGARCFET